MVVCVWPCTKFRGIIALHIEFGCAPKFLGITVLCVCLCTRSLGNYAFGRETANFRHQVSKSMRFSALDVSKKSLTNFVVFFPIQFLNSDFENLIFKGREIKNSKNYINRDFRILCVGAAKPETEEEKTYRNTMFGFFGILPRHNVCVCVLKVPFGGLFEKSNK